MSLKISELSRKNWIGNISPTANGLIIKMVKKRSNAVSFWTNVVFLETDPNDFATNIKHKITKAEAEMIFVIENTRINVGSLCSQINVIFS